MKKLLFLALMVAAAVAPAMAERIGTMKISGAYCQYDTLIHRHVGPGVSYTQFQFNDMKIREGIPYKMRMHLFTIDMTSPYNQVSPYLAMDTYYESATQDQEVRRQKRLGMKPVATVNGCAFVQSPPGPGEPYGYMEVINNLVTNGLVRYESDAPRARYYTDDEKKAHVGSLTMKASVTSASGTKAEIGQINHFRDFVRNSNKLALFCNNMPSAQDTRPDDGYGVFLKGDPIRVGRNQLEVVRRATGAGGYIEKGQCVISGVGQQMEDFLRGLEIGETVTIDIGYIDGSGKPVGLLDTYTAFIANCVKEGVAAGWEKENYAISATGVSKDGSTLYLADLEISPYSNAPARCVEDFLIAVGAWNACYNDGGPSAEMTVDGRFVTNNSIGGGFNGRYCPTGVMIYSTAPYDYELASLECTDNSTRKLSIGDSFTLKIYGYNQYGEMIDEYAIENEQVEISCPEEIGTISPEGKFTATHNGSGEIVFSLPDHGTQIRIPVIVGTPSGLIIYPNKVFTGEFRPVQLRAQYVVGSKIMDIDPSLITWKVDDKYVVSSCRNGKVVPFMDGYATITATYHDVSAVVTVEVENLEEDNIPYIELTDMFTSPDNINLRLPSVPQGIYIETWTEDQQLLVLRYMSGDKEVKKALDNNKEGAINHQTIKLDYDAPDIYPVTIKNLSPSTAEIKRLIAVYTGLPTAINELSADEASHFEFSRSGEKLTLINCSAATEVKATVYAFDGTKLSEVKAYLTEAGSCTLDVRMNEPVIVRVQTKNGVRVFKLMTR